MMTKRYVFGEIVTRVSDSLKEEGFKYSKSSEGIMRYHSDGFDIILFKVVNYWPIFEIEMFLGGRINKVEEIVNMFTRYSFASPQYMKYTKTYGTSYKVLSGAAENLIRVETEVELDRAINKFSALIKSKGLPFFESQKDLVALNGIKKRQILHEHKGLGYFHNGRSLMQSLVLMKLCNDPDFEELGNKYREFLVPDYGFEELDRKALDDLIAYLRETKLA